jgi:hypothetical protein
MKAGLTLRPHLQLVLRDPLTPRFQSLPSFSSSSSPSQPHPHGGAGERSHLDELSDGIFARRRWEGERKQTGGPEKDTAGSAKIDEKQEQGITDEFERVRPGGCVRVCVSEGFK